jgi:hypothetical protein
MSYDTDRNQAIAINVAINAAVALAVPTEDPLNTFLESVELITEKVLGVHAVYAIGAAFPGTTVVATAAPAPVQLPPAAVPAAIPAPAPAAVPPAPIPGAADGDPQVSALWRELLADAAAGQLTGRWHDNRARKASGQYKRTAPDFKSKADGDRALWIQDRKNPSWVATALAQAGL